MALSQHLAQFFNQTITIAPFSTEGDFGGGMTYGTTVSYKAKIEAHVINIRTDFDREIKSTRLIYLNTQVTTISTKDLLTLPAAFAPITPLILSVRTVLDRDGISHIVLRTE